jgi:hypothetical protein
MVSLQAVNYGFAALGLLLAQRQLPPLANLIADHCASSCATHRSQCAAENRIARYPANHCAGSGSDLRIGRAGAATAHCHQASNSGRNQKFCIHGHHLQNLSFR